MAPGQVPPVQVEDQRALGQGLARAGGAREEPGPLPVDDWMEPRFYAFNSVMGSGKTAMAAHKAKLHYSADWPVFHTGAFKFGNYIKRGELYHFSDALPAGAFIFHAV